MPPPTFTAEGGAEEPSEVREDGGVALSNPSLPTRGLPSLGGPWTQGSPQLRGSAVTSTVASLTTLIPQASPPASANHTRWAPFSKPAWPCTALSTCQPLGMNPQMLFGLNFPHPHPKGGKMPGRRCFSHLEVGGWTSSTLWGHVTGRCVVANDDVLQTPLESECSYPHWCFPSSRG